MEPYDRPGTVLRGMAAITDYLRHRLNEPGLSVSKVRQWAAANPPKIRTCTFGAQITARPEELDADLTGRWAA